MKLDRRLQDREGLRFAQYATVNIYVNRNLITSDIILLNFRKRYLN